MALALVHGYEIHALPVQAGVAGALVNVHLAVEACTSGADKMDGREEDAIMDNLKTVDGTLHVENAWHCTL